MDSVQILSNIDKEKAATVFKTAIEKSFHHLNLPSAFLSRMRLSAPTMDQISDLRQLERKIQEAFDEEKETTFELIVDYIDKISTLSKEDAETHGKNCMHPCLLKKGNPLKSFM